MLWYSREACHGINELNKLVKDRGASEGNSISIFSSSLGSTHQDAFPQPQTACRTLLPPECEHPHARIHKSSGWEKNPVILRTSKSYEALKKDPVQCASQVVGFLIAILIGAARRQPLIRLHRFLTNAGQAFINRRIRRGSTRLVL
jgi:hypothetical protein